MGRAPLLGEHPHVARLIVVHPDLGLQAGLTVLFRRRYTVDTASALLKVPDRPFLGLAVVVLDGGLLGTDAVTTLDRVRWRDPACSVVAIVGPEDRGALRAVRDGHLERPLSKPLRLEVLLERLTRLGLPLASGPHGPVSRAIEYLMSHYHEPVRVAAISGAAGVSASHLAHRFPRETGLTVKRLVAELRVEVAKRILADQEVPLERVAAWTGFADASHLSRVFHGCARQRPGAYRSAAQAALQRPVRHVFYFPAPAAVLSI
jgi:AraC-like DNA-binding protein